MRFCKNAIKSLSMLSKKVKLFLLFFILVLSFSHVAAQHEKTTENNEVLQRSINLLKRYFFNDNNWYVTSPGATKDVKSLINFIEDEPLDTIMENLNKSYRDSLNYVFRLPENVEDSLNVPGYHFLFRGKQRN